MSDRARLAHSVFFAAGLAYLVAAAYELAVLTRSHFSGILWFLPAAATLTMSVAYGLFVHGWMLSA